MNDELNGLGYVSSAPDLVQADEPHAQDEADYSTLVAIFHLLQDRKKYYRSVDSLSLDDKTFTIEQQLAVNKKVLFHIQELQGTISSAIKKVKAKRDGRTN